MAKLGDFTFSCNVGGMCMSCPDSLHKLQQVCLHVIRSWDLYDLRLSWLNALIEVVHLIG